nr:T9SS type A sorting domain-containing protein [Chitinophagaceae bacterium]
MKRLILMQLLLLAYLHGNAQNLMGNRWVVGGWRAMYVQFDGVNKPLMNVQYDSSAAAVFPYYYIAGHSNICDSASGKLLFSTTGMLIHDTTGSIMDNGDHLVGQKYYNYNFYPAAPYTQASLILPKGNIGQYYVFIATLSDSAYDYYITNLGGAVVPFDRLQYNVVDMNLNNGKGSVIVKNKMLLQGVAIHKTMMQACRHSNGVDWWLLKQGEYDTNRIYRFLVKADTIEGPWIQNFADPKYPSYDLTGQYAFSKDGTKFASVQGWGKMNKLFLADFDRCTGELKNPKVITIPIDSTTYPQFDNTGLLDSINTGVCFSPNGQFIYISKRWNIYQYEYNEPDSMLAWYRVQHGPDTSFLKFQYYSQLARGLDERIYIGNVNGQHRQMSVIDMPDIKGIGCQFCRKCLRSNTNLAFGLTAPPNMPDYNLGASGQVCWPLGSSEIGDKSSEMLEVYPNPTSTILYIKNSKGKKKELYNTIGQLIYTTKKEEIDVRRLARGIYYLRCDGQSKKVLIE